MQNNSVEIPEGMFNSEAYFTTRSGLCVVNSFVSRILPAYTSLIPKRGIEGLDFVDLSRSMRDSKIIIEHLGGEEESHKYAFTPDQTAEVIDGQKNGEDGVLLNNGYANIFYVLGRNGLLFAVDVRWHSAERRWYVFAHELGELGYWQSGRRVFRNKR